MRGTAKAGNAREKRIKQCRKKSAAGCPFKTFLLGEGMQMAPRSTRKSGDRGLGRFMVGKGEWGKVQRKKKYAAGNLTSLKRRSATTLKKAHD